jgi:hypothetical protein
MKSEKNIASSIFPFHVFIFGIYPVLALYLFNISEVLFISIQKAVITSIVFTLGIFLVWLAIIRSWEKTALIATLTIIFFFTYGHVFDVTDEIIRRRYFIAVWALLYLVCLFFTLRVKNVRPVTQSLNSISLILVGLVGFQLLVPAVRSTFSKSLSENAAPPVSASAKSDGRDVYYILVDAFSRQDVLAENFGVDASGFISQLEELGFYIPNCTQSNYDKTVVSLVSTLNMNYLEELGFSYESKSSDMASTLRHSTTRKLFEDMGYDMVTFKSIYPWLAITDSTYYYDYFESEDEPTDLASLNFQYLFLRTTAALPLIEWLELRPEITLPPFWANWIPVGNAFESREYLQYQQNVFALETLEKLPDLPGKKFVYAHLYITHQPFVFYPDGSFHPFLKQDNQAYADQVLFAETRLLEIVKTILAESEKPPIIIIQGDHSYPNGIERVRIFNAYHLPDGGNENLYETITPVNTFRVVFNTYFGGDYELLPDKSWYGHVEETLKEAPSSCVK